jgi:hypothetical protein
MSTGESARDVGLRRRPSEVSSTYKGHSQLLLVNRVFAFESADIIQLLKQPHLNTQPTGDPFIFGPSIY